MGLTIALSVVCLHRHVPVGVCACAQECVSVRGCAGDRVCGGWWPRLEDTPVLAAALSGMFLSQRTCCPNSTEDETEGISRWPCCGCARVSGCRESGSLQHLSCSCSCSPVFPGFPCAAVSGLCTHTSPLQPSPVPLCASPAAFCKDPNTSWQKSSKR